MAIFRHFQQVDQSLGEVGVNLDQVVRIERSETDGTRRDSPIRNVVATFVMSDGSRVAVEVTSNFRDLAEQGALDGEFRSFIEDLNPSAVGPAGAGRRR